MLWVEESKSVLQYFHVSHAGGVFFWGDTQHEKKFDIYWVRGLYLSTTFMLQQWTQLMDRGLSAVFVGAQSRGERILVCEQYCK